MVGFTGVSSLCVSDWLTMPVTLRTSVVEKNKQENRETGRQGEAGRLAGGEYTLTLLSFRKPLEKKMCVNRDFFG